MARFEIVAHVIRDIECETLEDAVAIVKDQFGPDSSSPDDLLELVVWRQKSPSGGSSLPPYMRQQLADFFFGMRRMIAANEKAYRGRVEVVVWKSFSGPVRPRREAGRPRNMRYSR